MTDSRKTRMTDIDIEHSPLQCKPLKFIFMKLNIRIITFLCCVRENIIKQKEIKKTCTEE